MNKGGDCSKLPSGCGSSKPKTPQQRLVEYSEKARRLQKELDDANSKLAAGQQCGTDLNSLKSQMSSIQAALADCNAKKAACERSKPVDNGAFNLNTRADLNHVRTGAGRKVYGTYQRGPKKGKLKKGYKFVNGVATKV